MPQVAPRTESRGCRSSRRSTASQTRIASPLAVQLGCELEDDLLGAFVKTDAMRETTVRGVFSCGDMAVMAGQHRVRGRRCVRAAVAAHQSIMFR